MRVWKQAILFGMREVYKSGDSWPETDFKTFMSYDGPTQAQVFPTFFHFFFRSQTMQRRLIRKRSYLSWDFNPRIVRRQLPRGDRRLSPEGTDDLRSGRKSEE